MNFAATSLMTDKTTPKARLVKLVHTAGRFERSTLSTFVLVRGAKASRDLQESKVSELEFRIRGRIISVWIWDPSM